MSAGITAAEVHARLAEIRVESSTLYNAIVARTHLLGGDLARWDERDRAATSAALTQALKDSRWPPGARNAIRLLRETLIAEIASGGGAAA